MSKLNTITRRIASATSTIRTRREDDGRVERHGASAAELRARNDATADRVAKSARKVTKILD